MLWDNLRLGEIGTANSNRRVKSILLHLALIILTISYILIGAGIFHAIEHPNEVQTRKRTLDEVSKLRRDLAKRMWAESRKPIVDGKRWMKTFDRDLDRFMEELEEKFKFVTTDEMRGNPKKYGDWTFAGSLFYAVSVLGTIGYGHPTPQTVGGKVMTVFFATFGLPLFWITLIDLSLLLCISTMKLYRHYFKATSLLRGKVRALQESARRQIAANRARNSGLVTVSRQQAADNIDERTKLAPAETDKVEVKEETEVGNASVIFLMLIILGYLIFGAILFPQWEGGSQWNFWGAFYFCFVSISTIGFGDMAPLNQAFYALSILYIIFGLILAAMCTRLFAVRLFPAADRLEESHRALVNGGGVAIRK